MDKATKEFLSKVSLYVATPCYGGMVTDSYARSLMFLTTMCNSVGIKMSYSTIANESLITRGRNELANDFLKNNSYTHLMFIDADIAFKAEDVVKMLLKDKEVIAGAYPLKSINWEDLYNQKDSLKSKEDMAEKAINYVINLDKPDASKLGKEKQVTVHGGVIPVYDAGTGFMIIKRDVFKQMIDAYPEIEYYYDKDISIPLKDRKMYAFFDTSIDDDGRYLSEDYTFCRRWQKIGGTVYLDVNVVLDHTGSYKFNGRHFLS